MVEKLSKEQLLNVKGGVTRGEYCDGLRAMITGSYAEWSDEQRYSAGRALEAECTRYRA